MHFDIRNYIWNIFEISVANKVDTKFAFELFMTNVTLGKERYGGATGVNYRVLNMVWEEMSEKDASIVEHTYSSLLNDKHVELYKAWRLNDKELFNNLCGISLNVTKPDKSEAKATSYGPRKRGRPKKAKP